MADVAEERINEVEHPSKEITKNAKSIRYGTYNGSPKETIEKVVKRIIHLQR